jgi:allantoinase
LAKDRAGTAQCQPPTERWQDKRREVRGDPTTLWNVYKETFDYFYLREPSAFLALSMHCHNGGRPLVTAVFDRIFRYLAQLPDVWFASYAEIARWVLDTQREAETHARRLIGQRERDGSKAG